jgi:opacity protein-like surface antigen
MEVSLSLPSQNAKILSFTVLFFALSVLSIYSSTPPEKKFELKLSGGISHLSGADFDASDEGWTHQRKVSTEAAGGTLTSDPKSLDWGWEIGGELTFHLSSRFALSGGVGYINGKNSSKDVSSLEGVVTGTSTTNLDAKAIPVTLGIYYFLPVSQKSRFSICAGAGYYFVSFSRAGYREDNSPYWIDTDFTGSGGDFGFHGGIGFEYSMSDNVAIVIEGFMRSAKIKGFEGNRKRVDSNGLNDSLDGKYYYSERYVWTEEWLPRTPIGTEPPSGEDVRNVRDLEIDFSGYTVRVGLKIKLF